MKTTIKLMALRSAISEVLSQVPDDLSVYSPFMRWYNGFTDERPDDMVEWEPFEDYDDMSLREVIGCSAEAREEEYLAAIELLAAPVRELGAAIEGGDPQIIADRWLTVKGVLP